jgi:hypothetical protein
VLGGMLAGTFLATPFVPLFYVLVHRIFERKKTDQTEAAGPAAAKLLEEH